MYYSGQVSTVENGRHTILYKDGDVEQLDLSEEAWRFCSANTNSRTISTVESDLPKVLSSMLEYFRNRFFMRRETQGFPLYSLHHAYKIEETDLKETCTALPVSEAPSDANVIFSHVLYMVKVMDDHPLKMKARIAPHKNEDSQRLELRSECFMCSPVGVRALLSTAALRKWRRTKLDVKTAFLQTARASRDVYVVPPRESRDRGKFLWLLLTAAYGLVNENTKFQVQYDKVLLDFGFVPAALVSQLFLLRRNNKLVAMSAVIVDDILLTGPSSTTDAIVEAINVQFFLGTIVHGPGRIRYFGFNITQHDDMSITVDENDKLHDLETMPLTQSRRREYESQHNNVEKKAFSSENCSIGWLGATVFLLCSEFASRMQQKAPTATVKDFIEQVSGLRQLKHFETYTKYPTINDSDNHRLSIVVFLDAGRQYDRCQL